MLGAARAGGVSPLILAAIAGAWMLAIVAQISGSGKLIHHDSLIEGSLPIWVALLIFVLAWQAMIAAMMLPSSLPLMRMFAATSVNQPRARVVMAAFLGGYVLIWTVFGIAAFSGNIVVHRLVDRWSWLAAHPWFIAAGVLDSRGVNLERVRAETTKLALSGTGGRMVAGSGVSPEDRATCDVLVAVLGLAGRAPFDAIASGLSVAGRNGTLVNRFRGTPAEGHLWAKTGSIDGVAGQMLHAA